MTERSTDPGPTYHSKLSGEVWLIISAPAKVPKVERKGYSREKRLIKMWTHDTLDPWCGHHLTHAHNLTTRAGISKPSTAVSAMLSVIGMTWPKLCPPLLLAFSPDGPTCELSSFI